MKGTPTKGNRNKKLVEFIDREKAKKSRSFFNDARDKFGISKNRARELYDREKARAAQAD
jgi:hypothetical protein